MSQFLGKKMSQKTQTIPSEATQLKVSAVDADAIGEETFSLTPYKLGQVVEHWYWGKFVFEVSSMYMRKDVIPALVDHDTLRGAGKINNFNKEDVSFSGAFIDNDHSKYVKDMKDVGVECSLRFDAGKADIVEVYEGQEVEVDGFTHEGPLFVFKEAPIMEVSFTMFGHVDETQTIFSKHSVNQEINMADTPTQAELEQSAKKSVKENLDRMNQLCADKDFVMTCFTEGLSIEEFSSKLLEKQAEEISALKAANSDLENQVQELKSSAPEGVAFSGDSEDNSADEKPTEFRALAIYTAKEDGISIREAYSKVAKENPELYAQFKDEAPVGGKK